MKSLMSKCKLFRKEAKKLRRSHARLPCLCYKGVAVCPPDFPLDDESNFSNSYVGFQVPAGHGVFAIPRVHATDITPQDFFRQYVSSRKPVVLKFEDNDLPMLHKWLDDAYLSKKAGKENVWSERRSSQDEDFGRTETHSSHTFEEFLGLVRNLSTNIYLSPQQKEEVVGSDGMCFARESAPLGKLQDDFPQRPSILGQMQVHDINLWFGGANGSSSSLHHDHRDNLMIVIRGHKRF